MSDKKNIPSNTITKSYKGFDLISSKIIPDCNSTGVFLKHRKTGLEVFHLLNNDEENLFAFSFRTPVKNSTGAAHILEHSVFCGSEKFPLKEPFTNMMNQSVNTFLNALTYPDKTVYPASSMVRSDYFNLMDVYGDAVFFPLLKKEAFMQEAHRVEIDDKGEVSIQGVVYNEMKGAYASFDSIAADTMFRCLLKDSNYSFDSGGDPLEIPSFTYEDFKDFHKKYYRPDNCLLFLYGNIPTEMQLDFIQERFLDRLEKTISYSLEAEKQFLEQIRSDETIAPITKPIHVNAIAPDAGSAGSTVAVTWLCGETKDSHSVMELAFLEEILCGHDGSPFNKVLTESAMGDDVVSGVIAEGRYFSYALGLHAVKEKNARKVFDLVIKTLNDISKNGVRKSDIDCAILAAEFSNREVLRINGPYSLILLDRVLTSWNYSGDPYPILYFKDNFEKVRQNAESDPEYIQKLIRKYLLDNQKMAYVQIDPSAKYLKDRKKKEAQLIKSIRKTLDVQKTKADLQLLHEYQQHRETSEEVSCIPSLKLSDLKTECEVIDTKVSHFGIEGNESGKDKVVLIENCEDTNGIVYFEMGFPVDSFSPEEYKYLPLFANCVASTGWKGKSWSECADIAGVCTSGVVTRLFTGALINSEYGLKKQNELEKFNICGRDYMMFETKFICEDIDKAFDMFGDFITGYEFEDDKHLATIIEENRNGIKSCVVPRGNRFAARRAQCHLEHSGSVDEIWHGITQLFAIQRISQEKLSDLKKKFLDFKTRLSAAGCFVHVTADSASLEIVKSKLPKFAGKNGFFAPLPKTAVDEEAFVKATYLPGENKVEMNESFPIKSQVGYAATYMPGAKYGTKEYAAANVLSHWLSGTYLWERIRTTGGAYGAYAGCNPGADSFYFSTYRDPSAAKSKNLFPKVLKEAGEADLDDDETVRLITGTYGDLVQPRSPYGKGNVALYRTIFAITDEDRGNVLKDLVQTGKHEILQCAKSILLTSEKSRSVLMCENPEKNTGVIIQLPL
ncbi:MAG: insulinase family protein [Treponema sp.]|nr:insulinase family protein [Treponema sp.]